MRTIQAFYENTALLKFGIHAGGINVKGSHQHKIGITRKHLKPGVLPAGPGTNPRGLLEFVRPAA